MSRENALRIGRVIAETYRWPWTAEQAETWVALTEDLDDEASNRALKHWLMSEPKPPTPAEFRERVSPPLNPQWDSPRSVNVRELPPGPAKPPTTAELHLWRAALGKPEPGCICESCEKGRAVLERSA